MSTSRQPQSPANPNAVAPTHQDSHRPGQPDQAVQHGVRQGVGPSEQTIRDADKRTAPAGSIDNPNPPPAAVPGQPVTAASAQSRPLDAARVAAPAPERRS